MKRVMKKALLCIKYNEFLFIIKSLIFRRAGNGKLKSAEAFQKHKLSFSG